MEFNIAFLFNRRLALTYASNHGTMSAGNLCDGDDFPNGITNGAHWYDVPGKFDWGIVLDNTGMDDYFSGNAALYM